MATMKPPRSIIFVSLIYTIQTSSVERMPNKGKAKTGMSAVTATGTASVPQKTAMIRMT